MHRRAPSVGPPSLPPLPGSIGNHSLLSTIHALRRSLSRRSLLWLALCGLALLVMTALFTFTWRVSSVAPAHARVVEARWSVSHSTDANQGNTEVQNGSYQLLVRKYGDSFSADDVARMEKDLIYTLHETAQNTSEQRGIVLPLFDDIAMLGLSLIMGLRAMDVTLPIEIPHCGDLKNSTIDAVLENYVLGDLYFYDVCELASRSVSLLDATVNVFCQSLSNCHESFRNFDIKLLAVTFSRFEEVMLLDADTLFFESPMSLWETDKYQSTGTLFFHDRLVEDKMFMGKPNRGNNTVRVFHDFMSRFNVSSFALLGNIERPKATSENKVPVKLNFLPSEQLLTSHSWNYRAGHEMDSSLVLWNKKRQPRATAILASFASLNRIGRPPSYGDKELFFVAAELAETQYAFSDFGVGGAGWDFRDNGPGKSVICGQAAHYYPVKPNETGVVADASVLYLNSDDILTYDPKTKPVYYSQARLYEVYPGDVKQRGLPTICPFDVTGVRFSPDQEDLMLLRKRLHEIAEAWMDRPL